MNESSSGQAALMSYGVLPSGPVRRGQEFRWVAEGNSRLQQPGWI